MLAGARFCRRCGQASRPYERSDATEAETKVLQPTAERGAQTQYHDPQPTGPSYLAPNDTASPQSPAHTISDPPRLGRHGILWASAILVIVILFFALGMAIKWSRTPSRTTTATAPEAPPTTGVAPPIPPEAPQPTTAEKGDATDLNYPGAEVTMEMTRGVEGGVRQLRTKDPFDKVVAWYTDKLKPTNPLKTKDSAVLNGKNTTAVINNADDETTILLREGIDQ